MAGTEMDMVGVSTTLMTPLILLFIYRISCLKSSKKVLLMIRVKWLEW